ncbi:MAG: anhydro-N-acetylmuramic acid kinase [Planctomycetota bacterium]|nr:anhydro-N-acetylmuramic acid kinase [Planctomycetota bacterium]
MSHRVVVGCMTGTSLDGIDAAIVEIHGRGLAMQARFIAGASRPLGTCAAALRRLADQQPITSGEIATALHEFAAPHVAAIQEAIRANGAASNTANLSLDLICVHGQTVYHKPPVSWQAMQPAPIARAFGVPVVFDLRAADLAAGGQGAPITPLADAVLFGDPSSARAVLNLGGFANFTVLPAAAAQSPHTIRGGDICACNQLLDAVARTALGAAFDDGGAIASSGSPDAALLTQLTDILARQSSGGRSLGTGDELMDWVAAHASAAPATLAATATHAIAKTISQRLRDECDRAGVTALDAVIVAGGSVRHRPLMDAIARGTGARVVTSEAFGVPAAFREAACFAVLGALCQDRVPITLPQVTGCAERAPVSGTWCGV